MVKYKQIYDTTDDDYERIISDLYVEHKRKLLDENLLLILFGFAVVLLVTFIGGFISMFLK